MFTKEFFIEHQRPLLSCLNSSIGGVVRRSLWIPDYKHPILKLTPNAAHVLLPDNQIRVILYSNQQYAQALHKNYKPIWEALHWWDMRLANKLMPAWNAGFDTYTSQPDGTAGLDVFLYSASPTANFGTNTLLATGEDNTVSNQSYRSLIKFDFSSITPPVVTSAVTFSLWQNAEFSSNDRLVRIYRTKRDFVEAQATWNIWKTSNNWSTAGGFHADDCEQTGIASLTLSATEAAGEKQWTNWTTTSLDEMINGGFTNNGFLLKADTEADDMQTYRSSDYGTAGERPKLTFTYVPASVTTRRLALLGAGK